MWSLAVEVAFYVALPALAYLLLVVLCRRRWRPRRLSAGLAALALVSPAWLTLVHTTDWLPDGARLWLPGYLAWFVGGMVLAVLQAMGVRAYALVCLPVAAVSYFIIATPLGGEPTTSPGAVVGGAGQGGVLRRDRHAGGGAAGVGGDVVRTPGCWAAARWCSSARSPTRSS